MARTIATGVQDFETIRKDGIFYIDKTEFIKEWWESEDIVTLITRPRRFGKTLNLSMLEKFFSNQYENRGDLFEGLSIWKEEKYHNIQGSFPVIALSFASVKESTYKKMYSQMTAIILYLYEKNRFLLNGSILTEKEKQYFNSIDRDMDEVTAGMSLHNLSGYLSRYYDKKSLSY